MTNTNNNTNLKLIETFYDEVKTIVLERYYVDKDGLRQSLYEAFYEDGKPYIKSTYKNNKLNGLYELFHENGQPNIKCTYKDGLKQGLFEWFDENGKLLIKCTYKNGIEIMQE